MKQHEARPQKISVVWCLVCLDRVFAYFDDAVSFNKLINQLIMSIDTTAVDTDALSIQNNDLKRFLEFLSVIISTHEHSYFSDISCPWNDLVRFKCWKDIETDLAALDEGTWNNWKLEAIKRFKASPHIYRGWQTAFDILNEAKAYRFLKEIGCNNINFIRKSKYKTPDLKGTLNGQKILCEVKTINRSKDAREAETKSLAYSTTDRLTEQFFGKISKTIKLADEQMSSYCQDTMTLRITYLILNFDDPLHEYAPEYIEQLRSRLPSICPQGMRLVLDVKPPFYFAGSTPQQSTMLFCSISECKLLSPSQKFNCSESIQFKTKEFQALSINTEM